MKFQAKIINLDSDSKNYLIEVIDKTFDKPCLINQYKTLHRKNPILGVGSVITVVELYSDKNNIYFEEIFDYEIGDDLNLFFINDFEKNNNLYRKLEDELGRFISVRRKNWQTGHNYNIPENESKLKYIVTKTSGKYITLNEKWDSQNSYDNSHLMINEKVELEVQNTSDEKYILIIDNDGITSVLNKKIIFNNKLNFDEGKKYLFKIESFYDDGYPRYHYAGPSPFFIPFETFDVPKTFFEDVINKHYDKLKSKNIQTLLLEQYKDGNFNWSINFQRLFLIHMHYLLSRQKFKEINKSIKLYEKFHNTLVKSKYFESFEKEKGDYTISAFGQTYKKLITLNNISSGLSSKKNEYYILTLVKNIINGDNLFSSDVYEFCIIWSRLPEKLILEKQVIEEKLDKKFQPSIEAHFEESKFRTNYLLVSIVIEETYQIVDFFKSMIFTIASDYRKLLREQLTVKSLNFMDSSKLNQNRYDFKFFIQLENLEYHSLEKNNDKPGALLQLARVKKYTSLLLKNKENSIKYLDEASDILNNTKLKLRTFLNEEELKEWGRLVQRELAKILEVKASLFSSYEEKVDIYKKVLGHHLRGASPFLFYRSQAINHYYQLMIIVNKKPNLKKIASTASLVLKDYDKEIESKSVLRKAIIDLMTTTSLIGTKDENGMDLLYKRSLKSTKKDIFLPDRQKYAKLVLSYNLLYNELDYKQLLEDSIYIFLKKGAVEVEKGNFENEKTEHEILTTIGEPESVNVEFKGTWSLEASDYIFANKIKFSDERKFDIFKAISGMLNKDGGKVIIGVLELSKFDIKLVKERGYKTIKDNFLFGIEEEIKNTQRGSFDSYILDISNELEHVFKNQSAVDNILINPIKLNSCTILEINIEPFYSSSGVWIKKKDSDKDYYFKRGTNSTISLNINRAIEYNSKRFEDYNSKMRGV